MVCFCEPIGAAANLTLRDGLQFMPAFSGRVPLLVEYQAVMTRPEHLMASGLSVEEVGILLDAIASVAEPVRL
jgi:hypothetical protein